MLLGEFVCAHPIGSIGVRHGVFVREKTDTTIDIETIGGDVLNCLGPNSKLYPASRVEFKKWEHLRDNVLQIKRKWKIN